MKTLTHIVLTLFLLSSEAVVMAQGGPRANNLGESNLNIGEAGIHWYVTWESAQEEAQRSGRPIMFVAAATQCNGISGVF